eukprot:TRINITY_DN1213_c0_g1_i1.p2 TRINITY_DN1213_c0_g1~~TRINITY_DN1213_c0_g1_i1.p2  ORF type:complete len:289 (-),score=102.57 TRINITY_DN1213_c0_g1_i1:1184-2050(-)
MRMLSFIAVGCALIAGANAWGSDGHKITASIAQKYLSSDALNLVQDLISADLSTVATWADSVKGEAAYRWSAILHYVDTPDWECGFTYSTDCADDQCVVGAIANYTQRIVNSDNAGQVEALKFLSHFGGDIHQPLHVSFASDKGGNTEVGTFMTYNNKNLHAVWDEYIIYERMDSDFSRSETDFLNYLIGRAQGDLSSKVSEWNTYSVGDEKAWAAETAKLACEYAYTDENGNHITDGFNLQSGYYEFVLETVEEQLIKGGIRLAALLNYVASESAATNALPNNALEM